jgi:alpha-ribazole phosphatase
MELIWIRHLQTPGNEKRQYIGSTDEPLSEKTVEGFLKNPAEYSEVERVICSPMLRCIQTAELMFPGTERKTEPRLRECDFGQFEGKTYEELKSVPKYIAWLKSNGTIPFPGGEEQSVFRRRSVEGAIEQIEWLIEKKVQRAAFVVHGGTIMNIMEQYALPKKEFYEWHVGNGCGYLVELDPVFWKKDRRNLKLLEERK